MIFGFVWIGLKRHIDPGKRFRQPFRSRQQVCKLHLVFRLARTTPNDSDTGFNCACMILYIVTLVSEVSVQRSPDTGPVLQQSCIVRPHGASAL
ncbi:hypothetical protein WS98_23070 [Burkholderia territorii]|nr:hypothetical protein WS98_23070 [Burkholderia territorii]KWH05329.1 hypothetical protein WT59_26595 [Burkholderia territorii]